MSSHRTFLTAVLAFFALLLLCALITPMTFGLSKYRVDRADMSVFPAQKNYLADRFLSASDVTPVGWRRYSEPTEPHKFHFRFSEDIFKDERAAIYIPSTVKDMRVTVNGIPSAREQASFLLAPGLGPAKVLEPIPRGSLLPDVNRAHIHYMNDPFKAGLRTVYLGPAERLEAAFQRQSDWERWIPVLGLGVSLLIFLVAMTGVVFAQTKTVFVWMALTVMVSVFQFLLTFLGRTEPFASHLTLILAGIPAASLIALIGFTLSSRVAKAPLNGVEQGALAFAFFGAIFGLSLTSTPLHPYWPLLSASLVLTSVLPVAGLWVFPNVYQVLADRRSRLSQLKTQVSEQAVELSAQQKIIADQMRERAILEERERFTRDIHDGIGGQLTSLLLRARRGKLDKGDMVREIQSGIDDLRLIVDSMDHVGDDLASALVSLRARISRQLEVAQIKLHWSQSQNLDIRFGSPRGILNLYRFVQEAVTNIVRHSNATDAEISILQIHPDEPVVICVADNGKGWAPDKGQGMTSLQKRADRLRSTLEFVPGIDGKGLGVRLSIPSVNS